MKFSESELRTRTEESADELRKRAEWWEDGDVPLDGTTSFMYAVAKRYARLARTASLLGAVRQSREWFNETGRLYLERIRAARLQRDIRERAVWESETHNFFVAFTNALLGRDEELLIEIATEAVKLDETYLDAFADDYPDSPARYWDVKVQSALVLGDDRISTYLAELRAALDTPHDKVQFWEILPEYYQALVDESASAAEAALADLFEFYAEEEPDPDDPEKYVLDDVCAYVLLARRCGLDVSIESDRLPPALLRNDIPADDVELDIDLSDLRFTSPVGYFEFDRDDDGSPMIAARMYHPGGGPVSAADVPEREAGQLLSDEWIEAALDEAAWRDLAEEERITEATDAFEAGTLKRKLVVVQDRTDGYTFDESVAELPVDDIELLKGAGR